MKNHTFWLKYHKSFYTQRTGVISGPETCYFHEQIGIGTCPDLSGPAKEDKYLLQTSGNTFFWDFTPFHFLLANFIIIIKSSVLLSKFIIFYKIMCFTKQIYRRQILIAKPRFYFYFSRFHAFYIFVSNFMIFHQN